MDIQTIAAQHPESVALCFLKYKIDAPINSKTLSASIVAKGEEFIQDLSNIIGNQVDTEDNWDGLPGKKPKKKKNTALQKAKLAQKKKQVAKKNATSKNNALPAKGLLSGLGIGIGKASEKMIFDADQHNKLTVVEISQLQKELLPPSNPTGAEVAKKVKTNLFDFLNNVLGKVKDTSENVRAIVKPEFEKEIEQNHINQKPDTSGKWLWIGLAIVIVLITFLMLKNTPKTSK